MTDDRLSKATIMGMFAMGVAVLVVANDFTALSVALPAIETSLHTDVTTVQWVINGYGFNAPTGRYTAGADDNIGSGYWGNDIVSGTTVYLTKSRAAMGNYATSWEIHGQKEGSNFTPGQTFTQQWGIGQLILLDKQMSKILELGVVGYDQ